MAFHKQEGEYLSMVHLKINKENYPLDPPKISKKILTTKSILEKKVDKKYIYFQKKYLKLF